MSIYELEERVFFDGAIAADTAEINEAATAEDIHDIETAHDLSDSSLDSAENVSIAHGEYSVYSSQEPVNSDQLSDQSNILNLTSDIYNTQSEFYNLNSEITDLSDISNLSPETLDISEISNLNSEVQNVLLVSSSDEITFNISSLINNNTILVEYSADDSIDTIIENIRSELGNNQAVNIGILNVETENILSNMNNLTDALNEIQAVDGQIEYINFELGNDEVALNSPLTEFFNTDSPQFNSLFGDELPHASTTSLLATDNCQLSTDLYFIDSAVDDANVLIEEITSENPDAVIIELEKGQGIDAMTDIVEQYDDIDSVHILSQGNYAQILLGDDVITANNIDDYSDAFSSWSDNLTHDADILFYGCDIAKEAQGQSVLNQIAEWTGADIAASTNITGSSNHGIHGNNGDLFPSSSSLIPIHSSTEIDWDLEYTIGSIEASAIAAVDYNHHLETYTVTETTDDGTGTVAGSLSWAIEQANATTAVDDTINFNLPEGSTISIAGTSLTISDDLTINGNGTTIIFENSDSGLIFDDGNDNTQINITINDLAVETYGNTSPDAESQDIAKEGVSPYVSTNENLTIVNSNINDIGYVFAHIPSGSSEIVFINSSIQNVEEIIDDLSKNAEIVYLKADGNGIQQITNYLANKTNINTMRIISHGGDGNFVLNGEVVDSDYLNKNSEVISSWKSALSENADIMLYGCNIAGTDTGKAFVNSIAWLTGADTTASTTDIGGEQNNWELDYHFGNIESNELSVKGFAGTLESWNININTTSAEFWPTTPSCTVIGQSFTAKGTGVIQSIAVASRDVQSNVTLTIYSGGSDGNLTEINSMTCDLIAAADVTNLQTINVTDLNISVTKDEQYTFTFSVSVPNVEFCLADDDGTYEGGSACNNYNNQFEFDSNYDLNFKVVAETNPPPTVTTTSVSNITQTSVTVNGNITSLGSPDPTAHGFCWNTTGNPDLNNTASNDLGSTSTAGNFSYSIPGLDAGTTYYVKAYATNDAGTAYGQQLTFITEASPSVDHFSFSQIADDQTAGQNFTTTISALDSDGDTVTDYSGTVNLTVNNGSISNTSITFTNGTADLTAYVTAAGSDIITATDQNDSSITGVSNSFTVNPGDVDSVTLTASTPSIQAGNTETLAAEAYDAYGNFITNAGAAFTWTTTGGTVTNGDFSATAVGAYTVTAALGSATANAAIAVTPGALDRFAFDPIADGQVAGVDFTTTITAQDAYYNTVTDYSGTADLTVNSGSISDTSITFTNGTADLTAYVTAAGSDTITATDQSNPSITDDSNSFTVIAGDAASINFNPIPSPSIQAGNTETLTAEAYDAYGNFITNAGAAFTWTTTGGTVTNGDFSATAVGAYTVTAALGSATANAAIAVTPGALDRFAFDPIADGQVAGVDFTTTITAQDAYNNTVTDYSGTADLTVNSGSISDTSITFTNGTADLTAYVTAAGSDTITATDQSDPSITDDSNSFTVTAGAVADVTLTAPSSSIQAGNTEPLTAIAVDQYGNVITDTAADFTWTNTAAVDSALFNKTTAQLWTVTAEYSGITDTTDITVTPGDVADVTITALAPTDITAGNTVQFAATAQDAYNNTITTDVSVFTWNKSGPQGVSTFNNGLFNDTTAGAYTVSADYNGTNSANTIITVNHGAVATVNLTAPSSSIQAGSTETLTAYAIDTYGNLVTNTAADFTWAGTQAIDSAVFTETVTGLYTVTATYGIFDDSSTITVNPGTVASVTLTPSTSQTLTSGDTVQFSAIAKDVYSNTITSSAAAFIWEQHKFRWFIY